MNNLVKIDINEKHEQIVSARMLYEGLGIKERFSLWWERNAKSLNLKGDMHYRRQTYTNANNQNFNDYAIIIDIAKHMCMVSGGEKAWEIRDYFIAVEKQWNSPEMVMSRALRMADVKMLEQQNSIIQLQSRIKEDKPKVLFAEAVENSDDVILVKEMALILTQNGFKIGQNQLFQYLRDKGFLCKKQGDMYHLPTKRYEHLFKVTKKTVQNSKGSIVRNTPKVTGKGQMYFMKRFNKYKENGITIKNLLTKESA